MRNRIYVSNLPFSIEEEALEGALREILGALGTVVSLRLIFEGTTLRPKGLCFAEMGNEEEARLAISTLNGLHVAGRTLYANQAGPYLCPIEAALAHGWELEKDAEQEADYPLETEDSGLG